MTDQTAPDVTNNERRLARDWAEHIESNTAIWAGTARVRAAARVILNDVPAPPRPTLADMTPVERDACQWMQADLNGYGSRVVILNPGWDDGSARVMWMHTRIGVVPHRDITPRPDLPPMTWPGTEKPAPALPDGWRLADHKDNGRVIVTNPNPDRDGRVFYLLASENRFGYDSLFCTPAELTYIDGDNQPPP